MHAPSTGSPDASLAASSTADVGRPPSTARIQGAAVIYRLYDVGYEIDLERVLGLLTASAPERVRPVQGEAKAIDIPNPPITVQLGPERLVLQDGNVDAEFSARIFDFGVVSLRLRVPAPRDASWPDFTSFGNRIGVLAEVSRCSSVR